MRPCKTGERSHEHYDADSRPRCSGHLPCRRSIVRFSNVVLRDVGGSTRVTACWLCQDGATTHAGGVVLVQELNPAAICLSDALSIEATGAPGVQKAHLISF